METIITLFVFLSLLFTSVLFFYSFFYKKSVEKEREGLGVELPLGMNVFLNLNINISLLTTILILVILIYRLVKDFLAV